MTIDEGGCTRSGRVMRLKPWRERRPAAGGGLRAIGEPGWGGGDSGIGGVAGAVSRPVGGGGGDRLVAGDALSHGRVSRDHGRSSGEFPAVFAGAGRGAGASEGLSLCAGRGGVADRECDRYGGLLAAQPIDLCCLGIGENGHVAFNDPPVADFEDDRLMKLVKLDEACRRQQVGEGAFPSLGAVPEYAYTLTVPALCGARRMICVVPERRKAVAVRDTLTGPISTACPASVLRRQNHAVLFLDRDSGLPPACGRVRFGCG